MVKKVADLPTEKVNDFRTYYERKQSIEDLCRTLSFDNQAFKKNESLIYDRLINDNLECMRYIQNFWESCKNEYSIVLKDGEEMVVDFVLKELGVRDVG